MTEQRLWIAVHLLYPNSSQAADVFNLVLSSLAKNESDDYKKIVFLKLESFFIKIPTVRSGHPFQVFQNSKLENWKILYKKSLKQHLLVIIGLIIFNLSVSELSSLMNITEDKVCFLLNQAFKKITDVKLKMPFIETEFKFRKVADKKVSYFYTNENLVEFSLDLLNPKESQMVEQGLLAHPQLQFLQKRFKNIIEELKNLISSNNLPAEEWQQTAESEINVKQNPKIFHNPQIRKSFLIATAFSSLFLIFIIVRPITLSKQISRPGMNSIKIHEVTSQPFSSESKVGNDSEKIPINLHEMPVESKAINNADSNSKLITENKVSKKEQSSDALSSQPAQKIQVKGKQGGLFRAVIFVSDLDTVTTRITEKLVDLGGKKAGEVELGWRKSAHVSYYHITLPEDGIQPTKDFLKNFGKLQIEFENHPRQMPTGIKRMILEVKEIE